MKTLSLLVALFALTGCANVGVTKTVTPDGTATIHFRGVSLFSNSVIKGLKVDGTTKTTTNLLSVTAGSTEPNAESITATGTALGDLIGTAAGHIAKP